MTNINTSKSKHFYINVMYSNVILMAFIPCLFILNKNDIKHIEGGFTNSKGTRHVISAFVSINCCLVLHNITFSKHKQYHICKP
jgi:hypothetical protein